MKAWVNHVCYADTWGLREHVFASHRLRLPHRLIAEQKNLTAATRLVGEVSPTPPLRQSHQRHRVQSIREQSLRNRGRTQQHHTKAEVVVITGVRSMPEGDGTTSEASIVVPRTAPHDPVFVVPCLQILAPKVVKQVGIVKTPIVPEFLPLTSTPPAPTAVAPGPGAIAPFPVKVSW